MEIHLKPDQEAFLRHRIRIGRYSTVDEAVGDAVSLLEQHESAKAANAERPSSLVEVCAMVKGLTDDIDFSREPSAERSVELQ